MRFFPSAEPAFETRRPQAAILLAAILLVALPWAGLGASPLLAVDPATAGLEEGGGESPKTSPDKDPAESAAGDTWRQKIDPWVSDGLERQSEVEFLVVLSQQADVSGAAGLRTKEAKGRYVFDRLRQVASSSQGPVLAELSQRRVEHRAFFVRNMIWVRGDAEVAEALARRADVAGIRANPEVALQRPGSLGKGEVAVGQRGTLGGPEAPLGGCPITVSSGIAHTGAPDLWAQGITGAGVVVGGQDTGYDWDHAALQGAYRGWNGVTASHDYNWHDSIHSGGGICGADSPEPCDDHSHGTHTLGTMIGSNGSETTGMAPDAKWIGCRNMDQGNGTPATYAECFEFFLAPTDSAGANADPDLAPDVINNSWGCPPFEGCTDPEVLKGVVENLRAAGVMVVVSAGNSGSGCSSVEDPASIYDASFTVGATDDNDNIAGFSSRGPVTVDGSNRLKPDISAPGVSVCSTVPGGGYQSSGWSGTSMAGPHVAGLVALLIDARPCLRGQVDALEQWIRESAVERTTGQTCGGVLGSEVPNNTYGYGAIRALIPPESICSQLFYDGFESGGMDGWMP